VRSATPNEPPFSRRRENGQPQAIARSDDDKYADAQSNLKHWTGDEAAYEHATSELSSIQPSSKARKAAQILLNKWNQRKKGYAHRVAVESRRNGGLEWTELDEEAPMGRGTRRVLAIRSDGEFELQPPYPDPQRAMLIMRRDPKYGHDVILKIERGQILTGVDEISIRVKFGDNPEQTFEATGPADYDTTTMFIHGYDRFIQGLRHSNSASIEIPLYDDGERVMTFKWDTFPW